MNICVSIHSVDMLLCPLDHVISEWLTLEVPNQWFYNMFISFYTYTSKMLKFELALCLCKYLNSSILLLLILSVVCSDS
jgi:hypothetical protein